jgi:hypothetical protein
VIDETNLLTYNARRGVVLVIRGVEGGLDIFCSVSLDLLRGFFPAFFEECGTLAWSTFTSLSILENSYI